MNTKVIIKLPKEENLDDLCKFLQRVDELFNPTLSSQHNLRFFAEKLQNNATLFEIKSDNGDIIALNAVYVNKAPDKSFATILAVNPQYDGYGLGAKLVLKAIKYCQEYGSSEYELIITATNNENMLNFYERNGFIKKGNIHYTNGVAKQYLVKSFK